MRRHWHWHWRLFVVFALVNATCLGASTAQTVELDAALNEAVVSVPKKKVFALALETTLYLPDGAGPFPVAVINHGKAYGDPRFQSRYRPALAARYFLQRGYVVVVPMRQGFSKSEGSYIGVGCNIESNGEVQADDVQAALDYVNTQPWADSSRIVVAGQSHGGWTTLAFGARNYPGVKGLVNFAGGLRNDDCIGWQTTLARGASTFAKTTKAPSIWFYGDNDSFFNTATYRGMFEQYSAAGGKATLVAYGNFGTDSHGMFAARAGATIWQPEVDKFLESLGMPHEPLAAYAKFGNPPYVQAPPKTNFAALDDESKIPFVRENGRAGYKKYLTAPIPRAFAIAPTGAWSWSNGGDDPLKRALEMCSGFAKTACKLYSVDEDVVWPVEQTPP